MKTIFLIVTSKRSSSSHEASPGLILFLHPPSRFTRGSESVIPTPLLSLTFPTHVGAQPGPQRTPPLSGPASRSAWDVPAGRGAFPLPASSSRPRPPALVQGPWQKRPSYLRLRFSRPGSVSGTSPESTSPFPAPGPLQPRVPVPSSPTQSPARVCPGPGKPTSRTPGGHLPGYVTVLLKTLKWLPFGSA